MMNRVTPERIDILQPEQMFVFGSNESGRHGAGAARTAYELFGALPGRGFGPTGRSFAIPTKDWRIETLPLEVVEHYVNRFTAFAAESTSTHFLVTAIGCGLAGFTPKEIAPLFREASLLENVSLPQSFWDALNQQQL